MEDVEAGLKSMIDKYGMDKIGGYHRQDVPKGPAVEKTIRGSTMAKSGNHSPF